MYNLKMNNTTTCIAAVFLFFFLGCAHPPIPPFSPFPQQYYKARIHFESMTDKVWPPSKIESLEVFQSINHFKGLEDKIFKNESPSQAYDIIGIITLGEEWYFASMLEELLKQKVEEVGGDAILTYETFQTVAARIKRKDNGQIEDLYRMSVKATVIRFCQ